MTTESRIEHDIHVLKMRVDITVTREGRQRGSPRLGVGIIGNDVGGYAIPGKEIDADARGRPVGRVNAATDGVETLAVGLGVGSLDCAAGVFGLVGAFRVAICRRRCARARKSRLLDFATGAGVQCHCVDGGSVDAFQDVDFAAPGPVGPEEPECGPDATDAAGHVRYVGDEEAFVEGLFGGDADGLPALGGGGCGGGVIDAEVRRVIVVGGRGDQLACQGCFVGGVFYVAACWIRFGERGEAGKEGAMGRVVIIRKNIAGCGLLY